LLKKEGTYFYGKGRVQKGEGKMKGDGGPHTPVISKNL